MTNIAIVSVVPPAAGDFLARWPQPYVPGTDDGTDWHVTTSIGTKKVQVDRLTDEVRLCSVMVAAGTTSFTVFNGTNSSPATGWTTPNLSGLNIQFTGHDGSRHTADLTSTTVQATLRDGHNERAVRRWTHSVIDIVGAGNQLNGTAVAGVHTYLHYRADNADVVELEVLISNASSKIKTDGTGFLERTNANGGLFGTFGFTDCVINLPTGWAKVSERPLATSADIPATVNGYVSNAHAFPSKMGTVRRWVLYKPATSGAAQRAQDLLDLTCLGRATAAGLRSWHSVRAFGPAKSLLPDLDQGYPGGYAAAEAAAAANFSNIYSRVGAGIPISDGGSLASRMGLFHPAGQADPEAPGGTDIQTYACFLQTRSLVRYSRLYGDLLTDSNGVFLFNRTTGRPITTSDFGNAYTNNAAPTEFFVDTSPQWLGRQPFIFYCQNNGGYEYQSPHQWYMRGWIEPEWPSHFLDADNQTVPAGAWQHSTPRWIPTTTGQTGHVATSPRTLLNFTCRYRPVLEYVLRFHSINPGTGLPVYYTPVQYLADSPFAGSPFGTSPYKDPEDSQHAFRMFQKYTTVAYLSGDLLSIDILDAYAEWFALEYSEVGHVPRRYAGNYPDDAHTPPGQTLNSDLQPNNYSLLKRLTIQQASPNTARYGTGRAEGEVGALFATQFALASVTRRETGYTTSRPYGIKKRCEMMYDFIRTGLLSNGASYRLTSSEAGGAGNLNDAFVGDPHFGPSPPPISTAFSIMQVGLELPLVHWALFCLGKQLVRQDHEPQTMQAFRNYTAVTGNYVNYYADASVYGPPKYWAVWQNVPGAPVPGQLAQWYGSGSGTPGFPNHQTMVELAYRIQGNANTLAVANYLGHRPAGFPNQTPAQRGVELLQDGSYRGEWDSGLIPLLLTSPGPDVAPAPPASTVPTFTVSMSPNPVPSGQTAIVEVHVTPGTNPPSTGISVSVDFSILGVVSPVHAALDNGIAPDVTAGDLVFTTSIDIDPTSIPMTFAIPITVTDGQGRRNSGELPLTISGAPTNPQIVSVTVSPYPVATGGNVIVRAVVALGSSPPSTGLTVKINGALIGASATALMLDDGVAPDTTAGDHEYAVSLAVDPGSVIGRFTLPITASDLQFRHASGQAAVAVYQAPTPATDPQIVLTAAGTPLTPGATLTLLGMVTLGTETVVTSVTADVSSLGGSTALVLLDDGVAPDVSNRDMTYTAQYVVPVDTAPGLYSVSALVTDADGLTGTSELTIEVVPAAVETDPTIVLAISPNPVIRGQTITITATVTAGTSPTGTGNAVTVDLSPIGGPASKVLSDSGVAPDVTASDLIFTGNHFIGANTPTGRANIQARVVDDQLRNARKALTLYVYPVPPPVQIPIPDHPVSTMYDTLTHSTARITQGSSAKIVRYIRNGLDLPLLQANVSAVQVDVYDTAGVQPEVPIWSTGRLLPDAQNADGTVIVKTAVVVDGQSPSRTGHTFEFLLSSADAGLLGDRSYNIVVTFTLIEPAIDVSVRIPLACDEPA